MSTEIKGILTISDAITDSFQKTGQCVERFISAIPSGFKLAQQILIESQSHSVFLLPSWYLPLDGKKNGLLTSGDVWETKERRLR